LPIAGPWRTRVEGSATTWRLERQIYSADLRQVIGTESVGDIGVRQLVASAGRQWGRTLCGYVLAGGGVYSLDYQGTSFRSPGFALTAGVEFPAGPRGSVQVDVHLHMINTRGRYPVGSSVVLDTGLLAGWVYRF
jgi:subtilisin family serine protease